MVQQTTLAAFAALEKKKSPCRLCGELSESVLKEIRVFGHGVGPSTVTRWLLQEHNARYARTTVGNHIRNESGNHQ